MRKSIMLNSTMLGSSRVVVAVLAALLASLCTAWGPATAGTAQQRVVSANPVNMTPNVVESSGERKNTVLAFEQVGNTMYAGGRFHRVVNSAGNSFARNNMLAFDATTGAVQPFAPVVNGDVWAIEQSGSALYLGGTFTSVNGVPRRGVAKIDATGAVDATFNAQLPSGGVTDMRLVGGRLIVGGSFPKKLAALNPVDGADTGYIDLPITGRVPRTRTTDVYRFAVDPTGTRLVAIGNFTAVSGQARSRAFMLTLGAPQATLNPWYYQPLQNGCASASLAAYLRGVDFSPDGSYFVLVSTGYVPQSGGIGRDVCDAAARFETGTSNPSRPTWINYTGGDTLHSVTVTGAVVYVQGHQRWLDNPQGRDYAGPGAVSRQGVGAIDPVTGKALAWNPGKTRGVGGKVLYATTAGLWVGSDGRKFAGETRDNIAFCPLL